MGEKVLLLGATGETGKQLLKQLLATADVAKVITLGRRKLDENHVKLDQRIVDFDNIEAHTDEFKDINKGFCCLGTTRGKAGKEGFIKVDHDYVLKCAQLLKSNGCEEFHLLSALGANPNSWFLYSSTKGRVEESVKSLDFKKLSIYRPGLLLCNREESRPLESWMQWVFKQIDRKGHWSVSVVSVARSMLLKSLKRDVGFSVVSHSEMFNELNNKE